MQNQSFKLYELERDTYFTIRGGDTRYKLHHIDGMYSYCTNDNGDVLHLSASTLVEEVDE